MVCNCFRAVVQSKRSGGGAIGIEFGLRGFYKGPVSHHSPAATHRRSDRIAPWVYALCSWIFVGGLYVDGWSHQYLFDQIDTFFNPWHAVLYGGYALTTITLLAWTQLRRVSGESFRDAIAPGHGASLAGACIFLLGGIADMEWHILFGFEKGIEGLISPSHLVLALGMILMLSGNIRHWFAVSAREQQLTLWKSLPLLVGMLTVLAQLTFLSQYARYTDFNASGALPADPTFILCTQSISFLGILLFSVMISGIFAFVLRRVSLPYGSVTFVLVLQVLMLGIMRFGSEHVLAAFGAGIIGDLLLYGGSPRRSVRGLLVFCAVVPAVFYTGIFLTLHADAGLWWSLHLWSGVPFLAGAAGLFAGLLSAPVRD